MQTLILDQGIKCRNRNSSNALVLDLTKAFFIYPNPQADDGAASSQLTLYLNSEFISFPKYSFHNYYFN